MQSHHVLQYGVENLPVELRPVWPSLPEVPRYEYAGVLTGWENFPTATPEDRRDAEKAVRWLVGLNPDSRYGDSEDKHGLRRPQSGVVDADGRIYITDVGQHAVVVFDEPEGTLKIWNRAKSLTPFGAPVGIALGPDKQILVADAELGRVVRLDHEGTPIGEFGVHNLQRPTGLARDPQRRLIYVADTRAHNIKVFDDSGKLINTIGSPGNKPGEFNSPTHLAFANQRLYISDTLNARIQVFDANGDYLHSFGNRGIKIGNMVRPKGVAADSEGNVYVVESLHDHLLIYDAQGQFLLPIGGTGQETGQFYLPSGVWSDGHGRIFISDMFNGRVVILRFLGGEE
ncbi:MAG: SMP-30/gluconolactonase/LRE family protein [Magnetococcales bacterium]|nr:SMP-30/gluconolactonase/LRE family protein [Magnetococcales bacterium]